MTAPDPAALALLLRQTRSLLVSHAELGISDYPSSATLRRFAAAQPALLQPTTRLKPPQTDLLGQEDPAPNILELFKEINKCRRCGSKTAPCLGRGQAGAALAVVGGCRLSATADRETIWGQEEEAMLWRMMAAINLSQEDVYVTNAVKCSQQDELKPGSRAERRCLPWLEQELRIIQPKVICAMGEVAANALLGRPKARFWRAKLYPCAWPGITASVMPTYHPRFLLRQPEMKEATWQDLQAVQKKLHNL